MRAYEAQKLKNLIIRKDTKIMRYQVINPKTQKEIVKYALYDEEVKDVFTDKITGVSYQIIKSQKLFDWLNTNHMKFATKIDVISSDAD